MSGLDPFSRPFREGSDSYANEEDTDVIGESDDENQGFKREDDEGGQPLRQLSSHLKRKQHHHSPTPSSHSAQSPFPLPIPSTSTSHLNNASGHPSKSPFNATDSSTVAAPPPLVQHLTTSHLADSPHEFYSTRAYPINQLSYRYTIAGPSKPTPELPIPFYKEIESWPQRVRWSWEDRSIFTLLTKDCATVSAEKGWRAIRANVPLREGNWYWEVKVDRAGGEGGRERGGVGEGSWCRVGVGRRESPLNAPTGVDGHSYAYRDRTGEAITLALPRPYGKPYASGSTIGIYLSLPSRPPPPDATSDLRDPRRIVRKRVPIRFKGQLFFESLEYSPSPEMEELAMDPATKLKAVVEEKATKAAPGTKARPALIDLKPPPRTLPTLPKSKIAFFLNGECQGVAFEDLYDFLPLQMDEHGYFRRKGLDPTYKRMENWHDDGFLGYFPTASVFGGGIATLNPGPDFDFPPPDDIERVLQDSPRPPVNGPIKFEESSTVARSIDEDRSGRTWRPLCKRYVESVAEQSRLDEWDRSEAIKNFQEAAKLGGPGAHERRRQQQQQQQQQFVLINTINSSSNSPSATPAPTLAPTKPPTKKSKLTSKDSATNSPTPGSPTHPTISRPSSPANSSNLKRYSVTAETNLRYEGISAGPERGSHLKNEEREEDGEGGDADAEGEEEEEEEESDEKEGESGLGIELGREASYEVIRDTPDLLEDSEEREVKMEL